MNISGDVIFLMFSLLVMAVALIWGAVLGVLWNERKHKLDDIARRIAMMNSRFRHQRYAQDVAQATPPATIVDRKRQWKPIMKERIGVDDILEFLEGVANDPNLDIIQIHRLDGAKHYTVFLKEWEE